MKPIALCLSILMLAAAPALARPLPQAVKPVHTPAQRAELQQELAKLQQRMDALAKRMGSLSSQLALDSPRAMAWRYIADPDRGLLGLVIKAEPDAVGYKVIALTPDGGAQQAGVQVGDLITHVNGKSVDTGAQPQSLWPLGDFKAGNTVKLGISRDGKPLTLVVKARRGDTADWPGAIIAGTPAQGYDVAIARALSAAKSARALALDQLPTVLKSAQLKSAQLEAARLAAALPPDVVGGFPLSPWWGLNLAPLNADLGAYFGIRDGALVLSTQAKRYPGLEAGDVITSVNDKPVDKPEDVMRALRGQLSGMTVKLGVRRHGRPVIVNMRVPTAKDTADTIYTFRKDVPSQHP